MVNKPAPALLPAPVYPAHAAGKKGPAAAPKRARRGRELGYNVGWYGQPHDVPPSTYDSYDSRIAPTESSVFPAEPSLAPGTQVETVHGGEVHQGEVVGRAPGGAYTVNWHDGTHSVDVAPESVRSVTSFVAGDRVRVTAGGVAHYGEVVHRQGDGRYTVNWDNGMHSCDVAGAAMEPCGFAS